jgi:hypothetical protein
MREVEFIKNKSGISEVIATVLLVMLSIITVFIIGTLLFNLVQDNLYFGNLDLSVHIDPDLPTPCYNSTEGKLVVAVSRYGDNTLNVSGIRVIAYMPDGNSISVVSKVPLENLQVLPYYLLGLSTKPLSASVAPIVSVKGKEKELDVSDREPVVEGDCSFSKETLSGMKLTNVGLPTNVPSPPNVSQESPLLN